MSPRSDVSGPLKEETIETHRFQYGSSGSRSPRSSPDSPLEEIGFELRVPPCRGAVEELRHSASWRGQAASDPVGAVNMDSNASRAREVEQKCGQARFLLDCDGHANRRRAREARFAQSPLCLPDETDSLTSRTAPN